MDITSNLTKFKVEKYEIKKYVSARINLLEPELRSKLSRSLLTQAKAFTDGYAKCLKEDTHTPFSIKDAKTILLSEAFQFIWDKIKNN